MHSSALRTFEPALRRLHFCEDVEILNRTIYKSRLQHRQSVHFRRLQEVSRSIALVRMSTASEALTQLCDGVEGKRSKRGSGLPQSSTATLPAQPSLRRQCAQLAHLLKGLAYLLERLVDQIRGAASALSQLLAQSYFFAFALAVTAALSRIQVQAQQMLMDVVQSHNTLLVLWENAAVQGVDLAEACGDEVLPNMLSCTTTDSTPRVQELAGSQRQVADQEHSQPSPKAGALGGALGCPTEDLGAPLAAPPGVSGDGGQATPGRTAGACPRAVARQGSEAAEPGSTPCTQETVKAFVDPMQSAAPVPAGCSTMRTATHLDAMVSTADAVVGTKGVGDGRSGGISERRAPDLSPLDPAEAGRARIHEAAPVKVHSVSKGRRGAKRAAAEVLSVADHGKKARVQWARELGLEADAVARRKAEESAQHEHEYRV
ncbi:hypothetical protein CYMTET_7676 [Cymbomonas tetramitiformis]|uniref:Nucleolus and neural progenitor protein-like N-terminal domain-containing protein n=1 Tax=Cymbomonas tetramitiformis TaxID=36881 RepID=A0AAE0GUL0_9CHLO|nr:hypothetical protein CYMTET_7676 [Cymbomonas tetramitiformis]